MHMKNVALGGRRTPPKMGRQARALQKGREGCSRLRKQGTKTQAGIGGGPGGQGATVSGGGLCGERCERGVMGRRELHQSHREDAT